MDRRELTSLVLAAGLLAGAVFLDGRLAAVFAFQPLLIVLASAIAAVLLGGGATALRMAVLRARMLLLAPADPLPALARQVLSWSQAARRDGLFVLARMAGLAADAAVDAALAQMARGHEPAEVRAGLQADADARAALARQGVRAWRMAARGALAGGILAAIVFAGGRAGQGGWAGLLIGPAYGLLLGGVVCHLAARAIAQDAAREAGRRAALVDALAGMAQGDSPEEVEIKLMPILDGTQAGSGSGRKR